MMGGFMEVTFHNVRITIVAASAKEAYDKFCNALAAVPDTDWNTDTYSVDSGDEHSTEELFPGD